MGVFSNTAVSLDGKIGTAHRDHAMFGSDEDRRTMSRLRALADAILVGGNSFRAWPRALVEKTDASARPRPLYNAVLTRRGLLDVPAHGWPDPRARLLILGPESLDVAAHRERFGAEVLTTREPSPSWAVDVLRGRGAEEILVEGGGDLIFQLLDANRLERLYVTLCPLIVGGVEAPTLADGPGFPWRAVRRLSLVDERRAGDELFLSYAVRPQE